MSSPLSLDALIIEQAADALIYCDTTGIIRRWNHAAERLFGYDAAEALGQSMEIIIPEHLRMAHWRGFDAAIARGGTRSGGQAAITRALRRDGRKLYAEISFALVADAQGVIQGAVAMAREAAAPGSAKTAPAA